METTSTNAPRFVRSMFLSKGTVSSIHTEQ